MDKVTIMAMRLDNRATIAPEVQEVLTRHGSLIFTRLGIPDPSREDGLITLFMKGGPEEINEFSQELTSIPGVTARTMEI